MMYTIQQKTTTENTTTQLTQNNKTLAITTQNTTIQLAQNDKT